MGLRKLLKDLRFFSENRSFIEQSINEGKHVDSLRQRFKDATIHKSVYAVVPDWSRVKIGSKVHIGAFTALFVIDHHEQPGLSFLEVGDETYIGEQNNIRAAGGKISIGKKCLISQQVSLIVANHSIKPGVYIKDQPWVSKGDIVIEDDVWIGCGVQVMPGVHIGKGAIVAAGSVVTQNVPSNTVYGGVPARFIKNRE